MSTIPGVADPAMTQRLTMQQQMNQMLLGMMQMLMMLMLNRGGAGAGQQGQSASLATDFGASGAGGASGSGGAGGTSFNSSQTPKAGGPKVQKLIDAALSKQGTPYVFGAAGPDKFDCSGLVSWALKQAGSNVPRMTAEGLRKHYANASVSKDQLQPGDLVFFWSENSRGIPKGQATHVEIYLGDGKTMGTDSPKEGAKVEPINWSSFIGGARPPELAG
jgi:cell wall-associated NlpC family hydrolase